MHIKCFLTCTLSPYKIFTEFSLCGMLLKNLRLFNSNLASCIIKVFDKSTKFNYIM